MRPHVAVVLVWGNVTVAVPVWWQEGLRDVFLIVLTRAHSFVPVTNLLWGLCSWFVDGDCSWDLFLGQRTGEEKSGWGGVLGRLWVVFPWGGGGGEEDSSGQVLQIGWIQMCVHSTFITRPATRPSCYERGVYTHLYLSDLRRRRRWSKTMLQ